MIYVLCNEDLGSGLIRTQLLDKCIDSDTVICVCRPEKFFSQIKYTKHTNVEIKVLPFLILNQRLFLLNPFLIFLNWLIMIIPIYLTLGGVSKRQVTARGYMAASLLIFFRSSERIWDARSLFFHEHEKNTLISRLFESVCVKSVDRVICVSNGMRDYFEGFTDIKLTVERCRPAVRCSPTDNREVLVRNGLVYFGSLNSGWNNEEDYFSFFARVRKLNSNYPIFIISQDISRLSSKWKNLNIKTYENPDDSILVELLKRSKYGVFLYPDRPDDFTRYGVKYATYKEFGLITVASENLSSVFSDAGQGNCISVDEYLRLVGENRL